MLEYDLCNGCHGLMQKAVSFNNVAIVYVEGSAYRIHFWYMSKDDAISIMNNYSLIDNMGVLYIFFIIIIYKKWVVWIIIKKNRDVILNRAKAYYENDKERLREKARDKNIETYLKKIRIIIKKKNMEKTDIIICLKKKNKN